MTPQTAIEIISTNPVAYPNPDAQGVWDDAISFAIFALRKLVGTKPTNIVFYDGRISNADCPCCGYSMPDIGGAHESYFECEQPNCCPDCGQCLDWSDLDKTKL